MRLAAKAPAGIVWTITLMIVVDVVGSLLGIWPLVVASAIAGSIVIIALARRWGHGLRGEFEAARVQSGTRPYIDPVWPRWFKLADPKFGGVLMVGMMVGLTIILVIALLVSRL
jgi:hypothetical protein